MPVEVDEFEYVEHRVGFGEEDPPVVVVLDAVVLHLGLRDTVERSTRRLLSEVAAGGGGTNKYGKQGAVCSLEHERAAAAAAAAVSI